MYSEKITQLREKQKLSKVSLAKELGVSSATLSKWEKGVSAPYVDALWKMAKIFNVSLDSFFEENDIKIKKAPKGMKSLRDLYKVGSGPSSSHTIGPENASKFFIEKNPDADNYQVILYGSLAKTGVGHRTDYVIKKTFGERPVEIIFNETEENIPHANTMDMIAYKHGEVADKARVMSVGGGSIKIEGYDYVEPEDIYTHTKFTEIKEYCISKKIDLWEYVLEVEGPEIADFLLNVWQIMKDCIHSGLDAEGILPGGLGVHRKAKHLSLQRHVDETAETRENRMVCSYAFAVSEENACGNTIVVAPTCGASGVVPAVLYYQQRKRGFTDYEIAAALGVGGLIGNLIKANASISGAECGCQAEIGSACAMAAAMLGRLFNISIEQTEYASEIAIEHHLGLTCDPVCGLVQIPCIERNAVAAMRAINAVNLANFLSDTRKISLDSVIETMKETGHAISREYRETSEGGLAKIVEL